MLDYLSPNKNIRPKFEDDNEDLFLKEFRINTQVSCLKEY